MFIKSLEIQGNQRLMIRGIVHIKLTFTEIHQIILGTNGSGKSTLMQELTPLPPDGKDYIKGGYRKIEIEHKDINYLLTSSFAKQAGEHSFFNLDTQTELNTGGTQSVQKTLIQEIFNFDQSLFEVLTDQVKFTNMSPIQRRDWLTRISGTNLDFAINIFNKLKKAQRDEEAVTKHFTSRLNKESNDIPTKQELDEINSKVKNISDCIEHLRENRFKDGIGFKSDTVLQEIEENNTSLKQDIQELLRLDIHIPKNVSSVEEYRNEIANLSASVTSIKESINALEEDYLNVSNIIKETQGKGDITTLELELQTKLDEMEKLKSSLTIFVNTKVSGSKLLGTLNGIKDNVIELLDTMIDNSEEYFTKDKLLSMREKEQKLLAEKESSLKTLAKLEHVLEHSKRVEDVVCPNCENEFKPGLDKDRMEQLPDLIKKVTLNIESKTELLNKEVTPYLTECESHLNKYKTLLSISKNTPDLKALWDKVFGLNILMGNPKPALGLIYNAIDELNTLEHIEQLNKDVLLLENTINKIKSISSNGYYTEQTLAKLENQLVSKNNEFNSLSDTLITLKENFNLVLKFNSLYNDNILNKLNHMTVLRNRLAATVANEEMAKQITELHVMIGNLTQRQQEMNSKIKIIEDITNSRNLSVEKHDTLKILVNEINPTTGLIADFFQQFINQFVEQVNIILNRIWEHNIELIPCGIDDAGLTYKFPLRVNDKDYGPSDCSKGSNSQITIVNFAFKIVVMIYLGLEDYPLYLDELAPDLDEKHRINIITFVRSFVESKRCSQMFMVSHYETGYGMFTNAEILVVDSDNLLEIPRVYNNHAIIERGVTL